MSNENRQSGIELLKIFGIFSIILSHVVQTLVSYNGYLPFHDYTLDAFTSTADPTLVILAALQYAGRLGNCIFLVPSIWFMLDMKKPSGNKALYILADTWLVSMLIFAVVMIDRNGDLPREMIETSVLPFFNNNTWYITCYFLLYLAFPYLNRVVNACSRKELGRVALFLSVIYLFACFFRSAYFASSIVVWVAIYFVVAYFKRYGSDFMESAWRNIVVLALAVIGNTLFIIVSDIMGLNLPEYGHRMATWNNECNPFLLMIAVTLFNLFRKLKFKSRFVNTFSGLSLLMYISHENILFRTYYRPTLWHEIYIHFGYSHVIGWAIAMALAIFIGAAIVCFVYSVSVRRLTHKVCDILYAKFKNTRLYNALWVEEQG